MPPDLTDGILKLLYKNINILLKQLIVLSLKNQTIENITTVTRIHNHFKLYLDKHFLK